jgi:hypothetical protein
MGTLSAITALNNNPIRLRVLMIKWRLPSPMDGGLLFVRALAPC